MTNLNEIIKLLEETGRTYTLRKNGFANKYTTLTCDSFTVDCYTSNYKIIAVYKR